MRDMDELVEGFVSENNLRFEGPRGVTALEKLSRVLGYRGQLEAMLEDNPGMVEAMFEWVGLQNIPEWRERLEAEVPDEDEDTEDEDTEDHTEIGPI